MNDDPYAYQSHDLVGTIVISYPVEEGPMVGNMFLHVLPGSIVVINGEPGQLINLDCLSDEVSHGRYRQTQARVPLLCLNCF